MFKISRQFQLILVLAGIFYTYVATQTFDSYPFSMDEYNYLYQAEIFAKGQGSIDARQIPPQLVETHMVNTGLKIYSKYPPGWPALLTIGVWLKAPSLVAPLVSVLTLYFFVLILLRFFTPRVALVSLIAIAFNPYFFGYAGSFFAQPLSLLLTTICIFLFSKYLDSSRRIFIYLILLCICLLAITRPLDGAVLLAAGLFALMFDRANKTSRKIVILSGLMLTTTCLLVIIYIFKNEALQNSIYKFLIYTAKLDLENYSLPTAALLRYLENFQEYFVYLIFHQFIWYAGPLLILISFMGFRDKTMTLSLRALLGGLILINLLAYNIHPYWGWPQYGSRYYYQFYTSIGLFLAAGLQRICDFSTIKTIWEKLSLQKRTYTSKGIVLAILVLQFAICVPTMEAYRKRFIFVKSVNEDIVAQCSSHSLVLLDGDQSRFTSWPPFVNWRDFKRNKWYTGDLLFVTDKDDFETLKLRYSGYRTCRYDFQKFSN